MSYNDYIVLMYELWEQIDIEFFRLINDSWSNSFFDVIMPIMREKYIWYPAYIYIISWTFVNYNLRKTLILIGALLFVVVCTDMLSSQLLKKSIRRDRPCQLEQIEVIARVPCGYGYSMPSSHAANHFAISTFIIAAWHTGKLVSMLLILWALLISYSQVYVGVHYPTDILIGGLLGCLISVVIAFAIALPATSHSSHTRTKITDPP